ncbi:DUF4434 domain-containing protein [Silvimonas iriomotensis]|uniref:DUF4434 domain-containing protein n=1 Tax=Silvimonas iriomotensis TaxID=449662 RepID=A0ABQ2PCW8_9NEIS|nr:DUF4434 domain-containing protein [Silvimonas iriomotensis]GGP23095.1 hypothetical protein GCM10010970_30950 [Silvimonas iriomotensis]
MRAAKLALLALLSLPALAHAMTALFYQPQTRDNSVPDAAWPGLFASVKHAGFDTLVVQWTQNGEAFATPQEKDWLAQRMTDARKAGLNLVIGLNGDPDFFVRQRQPLRILETYFRSHSHADAQLAQYWVKRLRADAISGWYLPLEIDDVRWRDAEALTSLSHWLSQSAGQVRKAADKPVYTSSFFAGHMAPQQFAAMIGQVAQQSGVKVWVQDGAGTGKLNAAERGVYLQALGQCDKPAARGVIYEIFRQTGTDEAFTAERRSVDEVRTLLQQRAPCQGDSVFFSLRYLPSIDPALPH